MNVLLFSADDRVGDKQIAVRDRRLQHLLNVHRASIGDSVRVGEINGQLGNAEIVELTEQHALLDIEMTDLPPAKLPLDLVLAVPRPKMLRRILRNVAELGVRELHLINSYRVDKSYWQTPVLEESNIRDVLLQGLEQARDTVVPTVHCHTLFRPFAEDELPTLIDNKTALLAHPGDFPGCPAQRTEDIVLVIGPEGGFIPFEVEMLQKHGCKTVSLGPRILRVENAVTAAISRLF